MSRFNFEDKDFRDLIKKNAGRFMRELKSEIHSNPKFKILKNNYLQKFWNDRVNPYSLFTLYIKEEMIDSLDFNNIEINLYSKISSLIRTNDFLEVDNAFNPIKAEKMPFNLSRDVKKIIKKTSSDGYCVFFFGQEGVDVYVKGENEEELNFFYTSEDLKRFSEKKDISKIKEVLNTYQKQYLNRQHVYSYFFAESSSLRQINYDLVGKNILKNKPEKLMRDHLKTFLSERMRHSFFIETELASSKKKLDIHTEVNGEFYFFEIKWLGVSISDCGTKLSKPYKDARAREGVVQSLEYIKELVEEMDTNVRFGYLVVFDARDQKDPIDYNEMNFIKSDLKKYLSLFEIAEELTLDNRHPA